MSPCPFRYGPRPPLCTLRLPPTASHHHAYTRVASSSLPVCCSGCLACVAAQAPPLSARSAPLLSPPPPLSPLASPSQCSPQNRNPWAAAHGLERPPAHGTVRLPRARGAVSRTYRCHANLSGARGGEKRRQPFAGGGHTSGPPRPTDGPSVKLLVQPVTRTGQARCVTWQRWQWSWEVGAVQYNFGFVSQPH